MTRAAGFTLLELMVAMSLLAVLALALGHGTRFGVQAWQRLDGTADLGEPVAFTQDFLRREIEQALPLPAAAGPVAAVDFAGTAASLHFVALLPDRVASPGLNDIAIDLAPSETGAALILSWHSRAVPQAGGRKLLIDGIAGASFAYYGSADALHAPEWQDQWKDARALPQLVGLRVTFRDRRMFWPALLVAPAATADSLLPPT